MSRVSHCRQCLFLGVNAVTRGLESMSVGCVLLAKDADPKILISHIPTMCGMQGVPILIMSSLRSIVSTALGFSCIALGIKVRKYVVVYGHVVSWTCSVLMTCVLDTS